MDNTTLPSIFNAMRIQITRINLLLLVIVLLTLSGCKTKILTEKELNQLAPQLVGTTAGSADDQLIVNCLLPDRIVHQGNFIYSVSVPAVKTTALDCNIKGGKYILYDPSDYETALKRWLSKAEEGDLDAQVYVGEIYEKGLGRRDPDYALAAKWYRKAAKKGVARAQVSLGYLYETGLGVKKDPMAALDWYRKASGLKDAITLDPDSIKADSSKREDELVIEVERRKRESDSLRNQLEQIRQKFSEIQQKLKQKESDAESLRLELDERRLKLENQKKLHPDYFSSIEELGVQLEQSEELLNLKGKQINKLYKHITQLYDKSHDLEQTRLQLTESRHELKLKEADAEILQLKLDEKRLELESRNKQSSADLADTKELEDQLEQSKVTLNRKDQEITELAQYITNLQDKTHDLKQTREKLTVTRNELKQKEAESENLQSKLEKLRLVLKKQKERHSADLSSAKVLEDQLEQHEELLNDKDHEITKMTKTIDKFKDKTETLKARLKTIKKQQPSLSGPSIVMIEPPLVATRGIRNVKVGSEVPMEYLIVGRVIADAGLDTFTVNNHKEKVDENGIFRIPIQVMYSNVPVKLIAIDNQQKRDIVDFELVLGEISTPDIRKPGLSIGYFGNFYALIIGNQKYSHWPKLKTPENDANMVAELLSTKYHFKTEVLIDATRVETLDTLNKYGHKLKEGDNLLIYYAGHGHLDEKIDRGYWIPVDGRKNSRTHWISNSDISDHVYAMSARHILIVSDSCYAGTLTKSSLPKLRGDMPDEKREVRIKTMLGKISRTALTSGDLSPVIDSVGGKHSVFANAFIHILKNNYEIIAGQQLHDEIATQVIIVAKMEADMEQVPQYQPIKNAGHGAGEFFFVPKDE
ncbi:MAG: hypothetical protein GY797_13185 [Deltaproteobacteria bacterium]|nr:hypothetical protein [Deltaproteobacteria bacterium]